MIAQPFVGASARLRSRSWASLTPVDAKIGGDAMGTIAIGRSTDELVRVASAGGGFWMNPAGRSTDELVRIAAAAKLGGGIVTIMGTVGRNTDELVRISAAGRGHIVFGPTKD